MKNLLYILLAPLYILGWILRFLVEAPFWLMGLVIVYVFTKLRLYKYRESMWYTEDKDPTKKRIILVWKGGWLTWLWGNEEDGIDGKYYRTGFMPEASLETRIFQWAALRNAVSNSRYVPIANVKINPRNIYGTGSSRHPSVDYKAFRKKGGVVGPTFWSFTTQGLYSGLSIMKPVTKDTHHRFLIGWKILRDDAFLTEADLVNSSRWPRCGSGLQFTLNRKDSDAFNNL